MDGGIYYQTVSPRPALEKAYPFLFLVFPCFFLWSVSTTLTHAVTAQAHNLALRST